jgi:HlyD family secretion protein
MHFSQDPINTLENLIYKYKTKSISIYLVVVLAIVAMLFLLPVIQVHISSQSRGNIRSKTDNVPVTTVGSGRITWLALKNNVAVNKGDTLIKISKEDLTSEKALQGELSNTILELQHDIDNILKGNTVTIKTATAKEDFKEYQSHKNELQSKVSQAQINYNRSKTLFDKGIIASAEHEKQLYELRFANESLQSFVS